MARTRTFIAVDPGKPIRDRLVALQEELAQTGAEVKWVEPENLHFTLHFLGEVDTRDLVDICRLIGGSVSRFPAFTLTVGGVGCFPDPRRPRIVWAGAEAGGDELCAIHDDREHPLVELGYRREERRFTPHLTLGRVRGDRARDALAGKLLHRKTWTAGETVVREVLVMGSELTPRGPIYTILSRAKLSVGEGFTGDGRS